MHVDDQTPSEDAQIDKVKESLSRPASDREETVVINVFGERAYKKYVELLTQAGFTAGEKYYPADN